MDSRCYPSELIGGLPNSGDTCVAVWVGWKIDCVPLV